MRIFNLDNVYNVVCNGERTKYGFRHLATLHKNGFEISKAKACYYNRTWECFEYESVLNKVIEAYFEGIDRDKYLKVIKDMKPC